MMNMQNRRTVLSLVAGGVAATIAAPTMATGIDPVYGLIETHRTARAGHLASLDEQNRLERLGDPDAESVAEGPCHAEWESFDALIGTAPVTFAGLVAWASYLDGEVRRDQEWVFEDHPAASTLVATFAASLGRLAVQS